MLPVIIALLVWRLPYHLQTADKIEFERFLSQKWEELIDIRPHEHGIQENMYARVSRKNEVTSSRGVQLLIKQVTPRTKFEKVPRLVICQNSHQRNKCLNSSVMENLHWLAWWCYSTVS